MRSNSISCSQLEKNRNLLWLLLINESCKRTRWEKGLNTWLLHHFPLKSLNSVVSRDPFFGFVVRHQFNFMQFVLWHRFLNHENNMFYIVYIFRKKIAARWFGGSVEVHILWLIVQIPIQILISFFVKCMNSYQIQIHIFYEFKGLNIWIHTNINS